VGNPDWSTDDVHYEIIVQLLILLTLANGSPIVAKRVLGNRLSLPLDFNANFFDGKAIFGASKTMRGLIVAIFATGFSAPLIGLNLMTGLVVGVFAMIGDLLASFTKRRLNMAPSSQAIALDQIPESLLPLIASSFILPLTAIDIAVCVGIFSFAEIALSPLLYKIGLRDRPF
jgi:CDP-diglyceride synthetase